MEKHNYEKCTFMLQRSHFETVAALNLIMLTCTFSKTPPSFCLRFILSKKHSLALKAKKRVREQMSNMPSV